MFHLSSKEIKKLIDLKCKSKKNSSDNPDIRFVSSVKEFSKLLDWCLKQYQENKDKKNKQKKRIQVVLFMPKKSNSNSGHCVAIDILVSFKQGVRLFILDHLRFPVKEFSNFMQCLYDRPAIKYYQSLTNLQKTSTGCKVFALSDAFNMSKINDLHSQLESGKKLAKKKILNLESSIIPSEYLPVQFLKNAQTNTWMNKYKKNNSKKYEEIKAYRKLHDKNGIEHKMEKYLTRLGKDLNTPSKNDIDGQQQYENDNEFPAFEEFDFFEITKSPK